MKNTLPIIISGYARSPSSINLKPFWSGFLKLSQLIRSGSNDYDGYHSGHPDGEHFYPHVCPERGDLQAGETDSEGAWGPTAGHAG